MTNNPKVPCLGPGIAICTVKITHKFYYWPTYVEFHTVIISAVR